jgi:hypothetical protein
MVTDMRGTEGLSSQDVIGGIGHSSPGGSTGTLPRDEIIEDLAVAEPYLAARRQEFVASWVDIQLRPLRDLGPGWDSYGGMPLGPRVLNVARAFLTQMLLNGLPFPSLVPTPRGGISLEWTSPGREFAISLAGHRDVSMSVFYSNDETGIEWEIALPSADGRIPAALEELRLEPPNF